MTTRHREHTPSPDERMTWKDWAMWLVTIAMLLFVACPLAIYWASH